MNKQLFVVETRLVAEMDAMAPVLPEHLVYLHRLETEGTLFAAGPSGNADKMT